MKFIDSSKTSYIKNRMKKFKLVDMRDEYEGIIIEAEQENLSYEDFLYRLIKVEDEGKKARHQELLLKKADFDSISDLNEINYEFNSSLDKNKIEELGKLRFIDAKENIIIIGPPGVGKSMIATGIGRNACRMEKKVLFINAKELVDRLYAEMLNGSLTEFLKRLKKIDLLIIDELSYIKMDKERESLFFQIIRQRYERGSLIITTNLPIGRWDELFTGQLAATAILDRLLHHCHLLSITGESYRVKGSNLIIENKKEKMTAL